MVHLSLSIRREVSAKRLRAARRRMVLEQLEARHAPGSLIPIPWSDLLQLRANGSVSPWIGNSDSSDVRDRDATHSRRPAPSTLASSNPTATIPPRSLHLTPDVDRPRSPHTPNYYDRPSSTPNAMSNPFASDLGQALPLISLQQTAPKLTPDTTDVRPVALMSGSGPIGSGGSGGGPVGGEPRSLDANSRSDAPRVDMSGGGSGASADGTSDSPLSTESPTVLASATSNPTQSSISQSSSPASSPTTTPEHPKSDADGAALPPNGPARSDSGQLFVLNSVPRDAWRFVEYGGTTPDPGRLTGPLRVTEGNSFLSQLELDWQLPENVDQVQFQFRAAWDGDAEGIRDALEVAWVDAQSLPILPTFANGRDSFFNFTEGRAPLHGSTTVSTLAPVGSTWVGTVTADVSGIPAGTSGTWVFRLINNDNARGDDNRSYFRLDLTNAPPEAIDDAYAITEDRELIVAAPGVLTNDRDSDDDPLNVLLVAPPEHGSLQWQSDGSFQYQPDRDYTGTDRFVYRATDGSAESGLGTVLLTISSVNDAPIGLDDHFSIGVGKNLTTDANSGVLANDWDVENDTLSAMLVTGEGAGPLHGSVTLRTDGSFDYMPAAGWTGDDYFTYRVSDGSQDSPPIRASIRIVPGIARVAVDSTLWNPAFVHAADGFPIVPEPRNLPWVNLNQVRVEFTEPVQSIQPGDFSWRGSPTLGIDYDSVVQFSQPDAKTLEMTLASNQTLITERMVIGLMESIRDLDGHALDGNGDGQGGDPANIRFTVVRGDVDANGLVLSNDVTLVRNRQLGLGPYDPFMDVNGSALILSNDVTLTRNNQLGLPNADPLLASLAMPASFVAASRISKFFVLDADRNTYRYRPDGAPVRTMGIDSVDQPKGIAMTANGQWSWLVSADHRVTVIESASGERLGDWQAGSGTQAEGIAIHGEDVWVVDSSTDRIEHFARAAARTSGVLDPDHSWPLDSENASPTGLTTNGTNIWVTDSLTQRVFVYDLDGNGVGAWPLDPENSDPSGITLDPSGGTTLWVVDRSSRRIYTYRDAMLWRTSSLRAETSFVLASGNALPEDIADPPPSESITGVPIEPLYGTTSFVDDSDILAVDLQLVNRAMYALRDPLWLGVRNLSRGDVRLLDRDGTAEDGIPYIDLRRWLDSDRFESNATTDTITLRFENPSRAPFSYELVVFPTVNRPPLFTSAPVLAVRNDGASYRYNVEATDPDADSPLRFQLLDAPAGMTIDADTGSIVWQTLPGDASVGSHSVSIQVFDPLGLFATQSYILQVLGPEAGNRPPNWTSTPNVSAYVHTDYAYASRARDPDGDFLTYELVSAPEGLTIDAATGDLRWRPTDAQLGSHPVTLCVHDDRLPSLSSDQSFQILVSKQPGNGDPRFVSTPDSLYNVVSPNPATGPVSPTDPILISLDTGQSSLQTVTYTRLPSLPQADVLFLLDDTTSMDNWGTATRPGSIALLDTIMQSIDNLDAAYPATDFAFGVARVENFALSDTRNSTNRPFILNQPLLRSQDPGFERFLHQALLRRAPGVGAGTVAIYEALYQAATGVGLDYGSDPGTGEVGPINGTSLDNGHSLDISGQTRSQHSGDVAAFDTPRDFSYRVVTTSSFPRLTPTSSGNPLNLTGNIDQPRMAIGWRIAVENEDSIMRLATPNGLPPSQWLVFDPTGARIHAGSTDQPIELPARTAGEYTLVLNSLTNVSFAVDANVEVLDRTIPLVMDQEIIGAIQYTRQIDRYAFSVDDWSVLAIDTITPSSNVQWRLIAPDGVVRDSAVFVQSSDGVLRSGDALLRLAPGAYTLEVFPSESPGAQPNSPYRFAVRTPNSASEFPQLNLMGSLSIQHQTDSASSARWHGFETVLPYQQVTIELPNASTDPNVRQWVVDERGYIFNAASTYTGEDAGAATATFVISHPGRYYVLMDGDPLRSQQPYSRTIRLGSDVIETSSDATHIESNSIVTGTVTAATKLEAQFEVVPSGGGHNYFFDPITTHENVVWTLQAPSGAIVARSRWDGGSIDPSDRYPRLSNRPHQLDPGSYRLTLEYIGTIGPGQSATVQYRIVDVDTLPAFTGGDILVTSPATQGSHLIRIDRSVADTMHFQPLAADGSRTWRLFGPDQSLRFELPQDLDAGYHSTAWPAPNSGEFLLDLGRSTAAIGTRVAILTPHRILEFPLTPEQRSEAVYITSQHPDFGVENTYTFTVDEPARFYFEPRPTDRMADADWSIEGPEGLIIDRRAFQESASGASASESNAVWLREGSYRLTVRSRQGDVDFRFVDLFRAGSRLDEQTIDGAAGPNPEGSRFFVFEGRQGDWHRVHFTEPNDGGSSGLLRVRVIDPFGRQIVSQSIPGPINNTPNPGFIDLDLDLTATGRYAVLIEDPGQGDLRRPFTIQREHRTSFPESVNSTLTPSQSHRVTVDSSRLLYDATLDSSHAGTGQDGFWFLDGLQASGDYPTDVVLSNAVGGRHLESSSLESDLFRFSENVSWSIQTYTRSVPTTTGPIRGGAGFRTGSVPIIVLATDTWSDVRPVDRRGTTQPIDIVGYGDASVPQDHLSGAFLNPDADPGQPNSFLFPDTDGITGPLRFRDLSIGDPPNAWIVRDEDVRSSEATIQQTIDALLDLGAYVLPVFMDYTGRFDSPDELALHQSWYDLPQALARLTGSLNASGTNLATGDEQFLIPPNGPLSFFIDGYNSTQQASQLTGAVSQFLQFGRLDVEVIASDPSVLIRSSGSADNLQPGQSVSFEIELTGDGTMRTFDLLFVRKGTGNIIGSIPVQILQPYRYDADAIDPDLDPLVYTLIGETHGATIDPNSGQLAWRPIAPGVYVFHASVSDGRGGRDMQQWSVEVGNDLVIVDNRPPQIEPIADQTAYLGQSFSLQVLATDADEDPIQYFLQPANARSSLPDGLVIDRRTGEIAWTATTATAGWTTVLVGVRDARGAIATTPMRLRSIVPPVDPNSPPVIDPIPELTVSVGETVTHRITGFDPQNDAIVFRLSLGNERGAILDPKTDTFYWTPLEDHIGVNEMIVAASDSHGAVSTRKFRLIVRAPNQNPVFRDGPIPGPASAARTYVFTPSAYDPDEDPILYSLVDGYPNGVAIDPLSGRVQWTPTPEQVGTHTLAVAASDDRGGRTVLDWTLDVRLVPPPNRLPIFLTDPRTRVRVGFPWQYHFDTFDPDGDPVLYDVELSEPMRYNAEARTLTWDAAQFMEPLSIRIMAWDGTAISEQTFSLTVAFDERNDPPVITSVPATRIANAEKLWRYDVNAVDPQRDPISYGFANTPPRGMSIDRTSGLLRWTPGLDQVGEHALVLSATDSYGATGYQELTLTVSAMDLPPIIDSDPIVVAASPGEYHYSLSAFDPENQALRFVLLEGAEGASITDQGIVDWPLPAGLILAQRFEVQVDTGPGTSSARQRWFVLPSSAGWNEAPRITSTPGRIAGVGNGFTYQITAVDADSPVEDLRYSLLESPRVDGILNATPMTIDPITGTISWTPVPGHLEPGTEIVEVVAHSDSQIARQRFRLRVTPTNREPVLDAWTNPQTLVGQVAGLNLRVDDPDGDPIRFAIADAPEGMFVDSYGRVRWATSAETPIGRHRFSFLVTDDRGEPEPWRQAWVDVLADTTPPVVSVTATPDPSRNDEFTYLTLDAVDDSGIATRSLQYQRLVDGQLTGPLKSIPINASGWGKYRFTEFGLVRMFGTAVDLFGNESTVAYDLAIGDTSDAPGVNLESPIRESTLSEPARVIGSVLDSDLAHWSLTVTDRRGTLLRTIATDTTPRAAGSDLGILDTTLLPSEGVLLVLTATDFAGQTSRTNVPLQITGALKLGNLNLSFNDLTIPAAGIPITVVRTYDTLRGNQLGDFGYGWSLNFQSARLTVDADTLGTDGTTRYAPFVDGSRVQVTLPDGTTEGFTFKPRARSTVPIGGDVLTWLPYFQPDTGNTTALGVPQTELNRQGGGSNYRVGSLPNNDSYSPEDPNIAGYFVLQTSEGTRHFIDAATGETTKWVDRNGNEVRLTEEGLISNRGRSVLIERNHRGLITRIIDPRGNALSYTYDSMDRLVSFQDRVQTADRMSGVADVRTRYAYRTEPEYQRYLDHVVDAFGQVAMTARYDLATGRLSGLSDALGNTAHQTYTIEPPSLENPIGTYEVAAYAPGESPADPAAPRSIVRLNPRGLPIATSDPAGNKTSSEYDSPLPAPTQTRIIIGLDDRTSQEQDDLVTKTDYSFSTSFSYAFVARTIDPQGNVTEKTYDNSGQLIAETDASGNTVRFLYDKKAELDTAFGLPVRGNIKDILDPYGNRTQLVRDPLTGLPTLTRIQARGSDVATESRMIYNEHGDLVQLIDSDGRDKRLEYDENGNGIAVTATWTNPNDPSDTYILSSSNAHNPNDKRTETENQLNGVTQSSTLHQYDAIGRPVGAFDATGLKSESRFDVRGSLIESRSQTGQMAINPITQQLEMIWNATRTVYDEQGRQWVMASGFQVYDSGELVTAASEITGTQYQYNRLGQLIATLQLRSVDIRIEGSPGRWTSRLATPPTVLASAGNDFDTNNRSTQSIDAFGKISQVAYDRYGNVVESRSQTQDEFGTAWWLVNRTLFDSIGRKIASSDPYLVPAETPLGKPSGDSPAVLATFTEYDERGRAIKTVRRDNVVFGWTADTDRVLAGLVGAGDTLSETKSEYDLAGRMIRQVAADGQESLTLYDERGRSIASLGHAVDPRSVGFFGTQYEGKRVRLRSETEYNQQGQAYRSIENIVQIEGPDGLVVGMDRSQQRVTQQVFDAKGQLVETIQPDGTSTRQEYDRLGRVIAEIDAMGNRKDMQYDASGRLVEVLLPEVPDPGNGDASTRPVYRYEYDSQGRMTRLIDPNGHTTLFGFDDGSQPAWRTLPMGQRESFTYDDRDREILHVSFEGVHKRTLYDDSPYGGGRVRGYEWFASTQDHNAWVERGHLDAGVRWQTTLMTYDALGRQVATTTIEADGGDGGEPTTVLAQYTWTSTYDRWGRVVGETTPTGSLGYAYDTLGRKIQSWASATDQPESARWLDVNYDYDVLGRLATVATVMRNGVLVDANGPQPGIVPETSTYQYDLFGRYRMTELPNGVVEDYAYDSMNRITALRQLQSDTDNTNLTDNALLAMYDYAYRSDGKQIGMLESFATDDAIEQSYSWTYDDAGRLISEVIDSSDDTLDQVETYIMDLAGNRVARVIDKPGQANDAMDRYTFDRNDRLLKETRTGDTSGIGDVIQRVQYEWNGTQQSSKRVERPMAVSNQQSMRYGLSGQLEQVIQETSSAAGVVTARTQVEYRYDTQGLRFLSIDSVDTNLGTATMDAEVTGRTEFLIDRMNGTGYGQAIVETQRNALGQAVRRTSTVWGADAITETVSELDRDTGEVQSSKTQTLGHDTKGSVRALFGPSAGMVQLFTYTAYGELLAIHNSLGARISGTASSLANPAQAITGYLYNGERFDTASGMQYLRARWYDPTNGRFERLDPYSGNQNDPFSYHKYAYVHGNPIGGSDPSGKYLIAIDGTGTEEWLTAPQNPKKLSNGRWLSHVRNFADDYSGQRYYDFGPRNGATASDLVQIENRAYEALIQYRRRGPQQTNEPVDLIGWSRGAYSALRLARRIADAGMFVRFLGLYDPVDMTFRDWGSNDYTIPRYLQRAVSLYGLEGNTDNVDYDYDSGLIYDWPRIIVRPHSYAAGGQSLIKGINATHGAFGGTPGYSPVLPTGYDFTFDVQQSILIDRTMREEASQMGAPILVLPDAAYGFPTSFDQMPQIQPIRKNQAFSGTFSITTMSIRF